MKTPSTVETFPERKGYDALWLWFGLGRASWLTIPRVLMHDMPDEWQGKMAELLKEYEQTYPVQPEITVNVTIKENNKFTKLFDWLNDYRHPCKNSILRMRGETK